jgi:hypothetical protein
MCRARQDRALCLRPSRRSGTPWAPAQLGGGRMGVVAAIMRGGSCTVRFVPMSDVAVEQGDEADEAGASVGASQLIPVFDGLPAEATHGSGYGVPQPQGSGPEAA